MVVSRCSVRSILSSVKKQNSNIKSRLFILLVALAVVPVVPLADVPLIPLIPFIPVADVPLIPVAVTKVAGFTPGELSVDQSGGAGYTLPIGIPAGVAGMQPELSINYSSGNGNGLLGVGFSLGGLSAITRCGRTIVQDGAVGGVEFTNSDRFCLNGQRLVAISGEYGQSDTEYRTEIDSMARIISHDRQGNGPAWFSIETKSGQTIEFGNTKDSRIEAQGKSSAFAWAQNKLV